MSQFFITNYCDAFGRYNRALAPSSRGADAFVSLRCLPLSGVCTVTSVCCIREIFPRTRAASDKCFKFEETGQGMGYILHRLESGGSQNSPTQAFLFGSC